MSTNNSTVHFVQGVQREGTNNTETWLECRIAHVTYIQQPGCLHLKVSPNPEDNRTTPWVTSRGIDHHVPFAVGNPPHAAMREVTWHDEDECLGLPSIGQP